MLVLFEGELGLRKGLGEVCLVYVVFLGLSSCWMGEELEERVVKMGLF